MALLPVLKYGHPILRVKASVVAESEFAELAGLARDMFETMYDEPGIGLAAPQIGVSKRFVVLAAVSDAEEGEHMSPPMTLVNPSILWFSKQKEPYEEGCLSVPSITEVVDRPKAIRFSYVDLDGVAHEREAEGLLARVVQHEVDHLDGVLFVDRLSFVTRQLLSKKLKKLAATAGG